MLQRARQAQADLPVRGDGDGEVAERFIPGPVGRDPVAGTLPILLPLRGGDPGSVEVMADLGQAFGAVGDSHPLVGPGRLRPGPARRADAVTGAASQTAPPGWVPLYLPPPRFTLPRGERVAGRRQRSFLDGRDRRAHTDDVAVLRITRQPVLVVVRADDRVRPPGTGLRGEPALAVVEPLAAHPPPRLRIQTSRQRLATTHRRQVRAAQLAHIICHSVQHELVLSRGMQPGSDRHTGWMPPASPRATHATPRPSRLDYPRPHRQHRPPPTPPSKHQQLTRSTSRSGRSVWCLSAVRRPGRTGCGRTAAPARPGRFRWPATGLTAPSGARSARPPST